MKETRIFAAGPVCRRGWPATLIAHPVGKYRSNARPHNQNTVPRIIVPLQKSFEALTAFLDRVLVEPVLEECLPGERRDIDPAIFTLHDVPEPLKLAVPSSDRGLGRFENRQVGLGTGGEREGVSEWGTMDGSGTATGCRPRTCSHDVPGK
jgi:hypothetical protein